MSIADAPAIRLEDLPDVLTSEQVAAVLQVSTDKVWAMCRTGEMPHRRVGALIRIRKTQFVAWLDGTDPNGSGR